MTVLAEAGSSCGDNYTMFAATTSVQSMALCGMSESYILKYADTLVDLDIAGTMKVRHTFR